MTLDVLRPAVYNQGDNQNMGALENYVGLTNFVACMICKYSLRALICFSLNGN